MNTGTENIDNFPDIFCIFNEPKSCIFELFFRKKKYLLVSATSMLWTGQWISKSVRDVCMSHQSDRIYYNQPIKFLVLKVNGV